MHIVNCVFAIDKHHKPIISGYITDASNGETLIGATVYIKELKGGTVTNMYGFYSLSLNSGKYNITIRYIGYNLVNKVVELKEKDVTVSFSLQPTVKNLQEVNVVGEKSNVNITRNEMSVNVLSRQDIKKMPAFMGEVDLIKAIQLLPGVQSVSEGSSGFSVRGGNIDQNLILLDEANIYNASHILGFFSVFNNDAIRDVKLYKGDIGAQYGGRLSSVLDIRMKDGNNRKYSGTGGIGVISTRALVEGPIDSTNSSFLIAARRTYVDLFLAFSPDEGMRNNTLYFYDLNGKLNYKFNDNNRIFLSGYFGRDVFGSKFSRMSYGNGTATLRWNHLYSKRLFSNLSVVYSNYYYGLGTANENVNGFLWDAGLNDFLVKYKLNYFVSPSLKINFGVESNFHKFLPGHARGTGSETSFSDISIPTTRSIENGAYVGGEYKLNSLITIKAGARLNGFLNYGNQITYDYNLSGTRIDSAVHKGGIYNSYFNIEPRLGVNLVLNEFSSVKMSYARTSQFMQMAHNSAAGTPLDIWFSASPNVKPQTADQYAIGYFRNFLNDKIVTSVEVYYKNMQNVIDFKDDAQLLLNQDMEAELRFGKSLAYGAEFMVKYQFSKISGWVSYTYSHSERTINTINNNKAYLSPFDKPHDVAVIFNYQLNKKWSIGGNWIYSSGMPGTFPVAVAQYNNAYVRLYSQRNHDRYPDYHRLDLSITHVNNPWFNKKLHTDWNISVYNVYNRHNTWAINFTQDEDNPEKIIVERTYLFTILPTITLNFKF